MPRGVGRWDELFADLEAQALAAEQAELESEVADRVRREVATLRLVDRLRPLGRARIRVAVLGAAQVDGVIADVGPDWLLIDESPTRQALVPLAGLLSLAGALRYSAAPGSEGAVAQRLTLGYALRALARERAAVTVILRDGSARTGTFDRVGADFVELAVHAAGEPRRAGAVAEVLVLPYDAVALVRTA